MFDRFFWGDKLARKAPFFKGFAAALAFYFVLAIPPLFAVGLFLFSVVLQIDVQKQLVFILSVMLPPETGLNIKASVENAFYASGPLFFLFVLLFLGWTCTNFYMHLARSLRYIFSTSDNLRAREGRSGFSAVLLVAAWAFALGLSSFFLLLAPGVDNWFKTFELIPEGAQVVFRVLRTVILTGVMFGVIFYTFRVAPAEPLRDRDLIGGTILATLGWIAVGLCLPVLMGFIWKASLFHGLIGSGLLALLWAYVCGWILLFSASRIARSAKPEPGL
jgi:membrane protein